MVQLHHYASGNNPFKPCIDMKKYYPVLLAKPGEFSALAHLSQLVKEEISPIIQVLPESIDKILGAFLPGWTFAGNQLYLDFSLYTVFDRRTKNFISSLVSGGINVIAVVQPNSDPRYLTIIKGLVSTGEIENVCIRFSNGSGGFLNVDSDISSLLTTLSLGRDKASVLLDFGLAEATNFNIIAALAAGTITGISHNRDYINIIIACSSFPENLTSLTPPGRLYRLPRYEWSIWQSLQGQGRLKGLIKYGDYGTKYPFFTDAKFQGTCSIKYTVEKEFIIYRGEKSGNHPDGNGQYITFAGRLIRTTDYPGSTFSWGDGDIDRIANEVMTDRKRKPGSSATWVTISQNHHLALLHSLL